MRVLLIAYAEKTHFFEMVPLAWALHNAGHEVRFGGPPALVDAITEAGLTAVPLGRDSRFRRVMRSRASFAPGAGRAPSFAHLGDPGAGMSWESLTEQYAQVVPWWWRLVNEPMIEDTVRLCRDWRPELVVWDAVTFAGALGAEAVGAPHARFLFGLDISGCLRGHYHRLVGERPERAGEDELGRWLRRQGRAYGVPFSERLAMGHFSIDHIPDPLRLRDGSGLDRLPMRYVPYNGRAVVPPWLREPPGKPRVCLSLGISATEGSGGYRLSVQELLDSMADMDVEVVVTLPAHEQERLTRVPANARIVEYVPLDALMPTCSAIIDHGGTGTVLTAAAHAVPQLVIPHTYDEPLVARGLDEYGAGLALDPEDAAGPVVRSMLVRLLEEESFGTGALRLRDRMLASPAPGTVVSELERRVFGRPA